MLWAIFLKSWKQHLTKTEERLLASHFKNHPRLAWTQKFHSSMEPLQVDMPVLTDQQELIFRHRVWSGKLAWSDIGLGWTARETDRQTDRQSWKSVLSVQLDANDIIRIMFINKSSPFYFLFEQGKRKVTWNCRFCVYVSCYTYMILCFAKTWHQKGI